jgi:methionyl-tRNA synthetase
MTITIDDWAKIEVRVGKILSAEPIEGSSKLLKLSVDFGETTPRQILSGIAKYFPGGEGLVGLKCSFVTNLEPRMMLGLESQGMLLAVSGESDGKEFFSPLTVSDDVALGTQVQ